MEAAYNGFVESVISLCYGNGNSADAAIAMAYAENELQHHHTLGVGDIKGRFDPVL